MCWSLDLHVIPHLEMRETGDQIPWLWLLHPTPCTGQLVAIAIRQQRQGLEGFEHALYDHLSVLLCCLDCGVVEESLQTDTGKVTIEPGLITGH